MQVVAVACEQPQSSNRPISHWTPRELALEVVKRGIVPEISPRSVARFLKRGNALQPHRNRYWLNAQQGDQNEFKQQVARVCQLYKEAQQLHTLRGTYS